MEFLEGKDNETLRENVETLLSSIAKRLKDLKNKEETLNQWEAVRADENHAVILEFLESLLQCNLPLCGQFLDDLLFTTKNPIQYLKYLSLRMKVTMSLDNFTKAREIAQREYEMAKTLRNDNVGNDGHPPRYLYQALFNSCLDNVQICRYQGHLAEAKKYVDEAQEIAENEGDKNDVSLVRVVYADWLLAKGLLNTAIHEVLHPLLKDEEITRETRGYLLQKLGNACRSAALWDDAKEHLRHSIKIAQETGDVVSEYDRATDLGNVYRSEGRISDALQMQSKHMSFAFVRGDNWGLSVACFNMGFAYYSITPKPELNKAMVLLTLKYILAKRMNNEPLRGIALNNIGKSLCALKQYETAVRVIGECVEVAKATGNLAGEGMALGNLGTAYRCLGEFEEAITHHLKYRDNASKRGDDGGVAIMQRELSLDYMLKGDLINAEKYIKDAIVTLENIRMKVGQEDSSKLANFDKNQAESYNVLQVILVKRGKIEEALALSEFARGRSITDIIRNKNEEFSTGEESWLWNYDVILRTKLDPSLAKSIIEDFYKTADRIKSNILVYSIVTDYNCNRKPVKWIYCWVIKCNQDITKSEERIGFKKHLIETEISKNKLMTDEKFFSSLCRSFSLANVQGKNLQPTISRNRTEQANKEINRTELEVSYPQGSEVKQFIDLLKERGLIKEIPEGKFAELSNISRDASKVRKEDRNNTEEMTDPSADDMPRVILRGDWEDHGRKQLHLLYDICIAPIEHLLPACKKDYAPRLVVLPHEFLFSVPFCALSSPQGKYLIERYCISYSPSLRTLMMLQFRFSALKQKQSERQLRVLSVGNPKAAFPELPPLNSATLEAQQLQTIFGKENCHIFVEGEATKNRILHLLPKVDIVHFATHAFPEDPGTAKEGELSLKAGDYLMRGFVVLASSGDDCNGLLLAREIQSVPNCECQLVTLSCCETGLGKVTGDGVLGLYRAFIAAGATGIVVTLWKIRDDVTPPFMEKFYATYQECNDAPLALRAAMLHCLKEKKLQPSQWAAFSYIGPTSVGNVI